MPLDDIALTMMPEIGHKTARHLVECFGSAERVFSATADELIEVAELRPDLAKALVLKRSHKVAEKELAIVQKSDITIVPSTDANYPALLKECEDHPHLLYAKGDISLLNRPTLAIGGTRSISEYGMKMCDFFIEGLHDISPEAVIAGGFSYGIDVACHRVALRCGMPSVVVLAHGMMSIYPSRHASLTRKIVDNGGLLITEFHSKYKPTQSVFLQRNRIIAGMAGGTLIIESPIDGGSLTIAELASGYYRTVMAVPGRIGDRCSEGTNRIISIQKATLVMSASDIVRELGWEANVIETGSGRFPACRKLTEKLTDKEQWLLDEFFNGENPLSADELAVKSGLSTSAISPLLLGLEMAGALRMLPGNRYTKR